MPKTFPDSIDWRQVLWSIPLFVLEATYWNTVMLKNYLKVALRRLRRHIG